MLKSMLNNKNDSDKRDSSVINQIGRVKAVLLMTLGSSVFFLYAGLMGSLGMWNSTLHKETIKEQSVSNTQSSDVKGVSTDNYIPGSGLPIESSSPTVHVLLNNAEKGRGVIQLKIDGSERLSEARLQFKVDGDLKVSNIVCAKTFYCSEVLFDENEILIHVVSAYADSPTLQYGKIDLVTIEYDADTHAELILNDGAQKSLVTSQNTPRNLISEETIYLAIGSKLK